MRYYTRARVESLISENIHGGTEKAIREKIRDKRRRDRLASIDPRVATSWACESPGPAGAGGGTPVSLSRPPGPLSRPRHPHGGDSLVRQTRLIAAAHDSPGTRGRDDNYYPCAIALGARYLCILGVHSWE